MPRDIENLGKGYIEYLTSISDEQLQAEIDEASRDSFTFECYDYCGEFDGDDGKALWPLSGGQANTLNEAA
jgi:hypothetical protein